MRNFVITGAILIIAVSIGLWQNSRLKEIDQETVKFESHDMPTSQGRPTRGQKPDLPQASASEAEQDEFYEVVVTSLASRLSGGSRSQTVDAEQRRKMLLTSAKFRSEDIERFSQKLLGDPRLGDGLGEEEIMQLCLNLFSNVAPEASMGFLEGHRGMSRWENYYAGSFGSFLVANPRDAIRWFEQQEALGNEDVSSSSIRQNLLIREAIVDPDSMLSRAMDPDFSEDPETFSRLGGFIASSLGKPAQHQDFLRALRHAQEKNPSSARLSEIRQQYIGGVSSTLSEFSFEDSSMILDSEFTSDERMKFVTNLSHRGDLDDPEKWADWLLKINRDEWEAWTSANEARNRYPAVDVMANWARSDMNAAGKYLDKLPGGLAKTEMTVEYAWVIAAIDPFKAASYLPDIPEGKARRNIVGKIARTLDTRDPAAAEALRAGKAIDGASK